MQVVVEAAAFVRPRIVGQPRVGVILGSGLSGWAQGEAINYADIPHFPRSSVPGHRGALVAGRIGEVGYLALAGRLHAYEAGADAAGLSRVALGVRLLHALGVKTLIVTNAAGAINTELRPGMLVLIRDHINLIGNPLVGSAEFVDMSQAYSPALRERAHALAELREGVYIAVTGPSYETPAEIRAFRAWGADLVGMSTAPEVIAARACGLEVLGISVVTNMAAGIESSTLSHDEVIAAGAAAGKKLGSLLDQMIAEL